MFHRFHNKSFKLEEFCIWKFDGQSFSDLTFKCNQMDVDDDDFVGPHEKKAEKKNSGDEVFADINFPQGRCLAHPRWKGTNLAKELDKVMPILYFDGMGPVDFQPAPNVSVIYLGESDLVTGGATGLNVVEKVKERVVKAAGGRGGRSNLKFFCVFQKSPLSLPILAELQLTLLPLPVSAIPIQNPLLHLPQLLFQLFTADKTRNPFSVAISEAKSKNMGRTDKDLLLTVCKIPGMREPKARQLLAEKGSLKAIGRAKAADLVCLGPNLARGVEDFFKRNARL